MRTTGAMGVLAAVAGAGVLAAACGGSRPSTPPATATATPPTVAVGGGCGRLHPGVGAKPLGAAQGSSVALADLGGRTLAYVADEDDRRVHVVDVDQKKELGAVAVDGAPSHLLVAGDGRVMVLLRDRSKVQVLEPGDDGALASRCTVAAPDEPVDLAMTPDGATLLVTSGWGHDLAAYDAGTLARRFDVDLPREPRAITVSDDGKKAFVAHMIGSRVSVVDLGTHALKEVALDGTSVDEAPQQQMRQNMMIEKMAPPMPAMKGSKSPAAQVQQADVTDLHAHRTACQNFALAKMAVDGKERIFAPQVLVDSGQPEVRAEGYGSFEVDTEMTSVSEIDPETGRTIPKAVAFTAQPQQAQGDAPKCLLPRGAAGDAKTKTLYVTCLGVDSVVAYDATAETPAEASVGSWRVPSGPTGVVVDPRHDRIVVWSQFAHAVSFVDAPRAPIEEQLKLGPSQVVSLSLSRAAGTPQVVDVELGRALFHGAGNPTISRDGRACASCHPDGRDDAITWATPDGPRQTPMLAGRLAKTAPYGWTGGGFDVQQHLHSTFERLGGQGLEGRELDALVAYVQSMSTPAQPAGQAAKVARGREIFLSAQAGCASCHTPDDGAFTDHRRHDVKSGDEADSQKEFDTPSLRFVGNTAPYFHDGRYATLRELLVESDGKMGHTAQLSSDDLDALEAYLRTL